MANSSTTVEGVSLYDALVKLPHRPGDMGFPAATGYEDRVPLVSSLDIHSAFEFGGHFGFGVVTWLHTFPNITSVGWSDNESAFVGSNASCEENIREYLDQRRCKLWFTDKAHEAVGRKYDLVMVDGDHNYPYALVDLALALAMCPKVILVDDMQIGGVDAAVRDFSNYTGIPYDHHPQIAAGTAVMYL
jgi:hypothetical protein